MICRSTRSETPTATFEEACLKGLAPDGGLYLPVWFPRFSPQFFEKLPEKSFEDIATEVAGAYLGDEIPETDLRKICNQAFNFAVPLAEVRPQLFIQELFNGPSLAFKDFGARFMARIFSFFMQRQDRELTILVATSGDTGGAVAMGFHGVPNIRVVVLYPEGKVSPFQERQFATLGENVTALKVKGTFDDCQALVKKAFSDEDLRKQLFLTSANSINLARLLPQSFYYYFGWAQARAKGYDKVVFSVPSGNFGNLCAGLFAHKTGLEIQQFIAAVNRNDTFYHYWKSGHYQAKPSVSTLSNAMDVGAPSNFERLQFLFQSDHQAVASIIFSGTYEDQQTLGEIESIYGESGYLTDPHTAVGVLGAEAYRQQHGYDSRTAHITLGTAHPIKFLEVFPERLREKVVQPPQYQDRQQPLLAEPIGNHYEAFLEKLLALA